MAVAEKERFFEKMDEIELALTYDDVRMRTRYGGDTPLPQVINVDSKFSENVGLKIPLVSAAMDTVTESDMAIAMAKLGGIGVIHAALTIEQQYQEARRVKKASHGLIGQPITVLETDTLEEVENMCAERRFDFRTFPVQNSDGSFVGMLTGDRFKYPDSKAIAVGKVMKPAEQVTKAATDTTLEAAYAIMQERFISTLPLFDDNGELGGLYLWSDVHRNVRDAGNYNVDDEKQLRVAVAVSTGKDTLDKIEALARYIDVAVIDTADGDSYYTVQTLKAIKKAYPEIDVVVGNISDGASAWELAKAGANGIKVGQGPGSICSTRPETGIGMPQVTAVFDCVRALSKDFSHIPVCADGGIKDRGDIPIAIAAGAHSVMMGRALAGTAEAPGEIVTRPDGSRWKLYRGMGSPSALAANQSSRERYEANGALLLAEGVEALVPFEGSVEDVIGLCTQALRKGMRYVKAPDLEYHREHTLLRRITNAGLRESHPHDVSVVQQ